MPSSTGSALATDLYQLTMAAGYFHRGMRPLVATCELFVRRLPRARRYLVALGIDELARHVTTLRFTPEDVAFLSSLPALKSAMTPAFCDYLLGFSFTGDMWAVEEGTLVFENEPLVRVRAPIVEAQILETFALSLVNHATMVGSKAARVVTAAAGRTVVEFGTRRTQPDAAVDAARAAYAVGFAGTSNVEAGRRFGIPVLGTAAHMWTMAHASEEAAFRGYFEIFPESAILLVDTYDTARGTLRAARICRERLKGVRLDSGDLGALSREARAILDAEGAPQAKILVSGDLNEHIIGRMIAEGAPIDTFGVGTEVVCSVDAPSLGGVYKLVELDDGAERRPMAKFSEGKGTFAGVHQAYRITGASGAFARDVLALDDEGPPTLAGGQLAHALLAPVIVDGVRVSTPPALDAVRARVSAGLAALPPHLRALAPFEAGEARYPVEPSDRLRAVTEEVRRKFVLDASALG